MTTTKSVFVKMEKAAGVTAWSLGLFRKTSLWAGFLLSRALITLQHIDYIELNSLNGRLKRPEMISYGLVFWSKW
jgi:hypothetical protein